VDIGGNQDNQDLNIAWKYLWTAKDTWPGPEQTLGGIGAVYNLTARSATLAIAASAR
jgi:hypothetical protein